LKRIFVAGSGGWGIALAISANSCGHKVTLWTPFESEASSLRENRGNEKLLAGIKIPEEIDITSDIASVTESDAVIIVTPSKFVRETAEKLAKAGLSGTSPLIICASKGICEQQLIPLNEVIESEIPTARCVMLSGPSHAEEVARGVPTLVVAASKDIAQAELVQQWLMTPKLRIYTSEDVVGVSLGGAFKNVIALAAGIGDGMQMGDNAKAALMTRGITEIARLGMAMGARSDTFGGLTGLGDLIVTCCSMHSRNRRAGILIGQGKTPEAAVEEIGMTVEGYITAKAVYRLAEKYNVEMPITNAVYRTLYEGADPRKEISALMVRDKKREADEIWI